MQQVLKNIIQKTDKIILIVLAFVLLALFSLNDSIRNWRAAQRLTIPSALPLPHINKVDNTPSVAEFHLFGQENMANLPRTMLQLNLQGIVLAKDNINSLVIISSMQGPSRVYHLGQSLPGGAIIKAIERDRVILEENKQLATLNLPIHQLPSPEK